MKVELFNDNFQNFKRYGIPKAQLVIADIPYNLGNNAYASNPMWYVGGDNKNGESKKAGKAFFNSDYNFNIAEYFHFCNRLLKKEPKERGKAPCMIVFCSFQQMPMVIEYANKHGFKNYIPITFNKNYSAQVLKANMRIVGATEYALILYREKLPKFNNNKKMIFDHFNQLRLRDMYVVWFCKTLQNWKALISGVHINEYIEVTYNGDRKETYVDVYQKACNRCLKDGGDEDCQ